VGSESPGWVTITHRCRPPIKQRQYRPLHRMFVISSECELLWQHKSPPLQTPPPPVFALSNVFSYSFAGRPRRAGTRSGHWHTGHDVRSLGLASRTRQTVQNLPRLVTFAHSIVTLHLRLLVGGSPSEVRRGKLGTNQGARYSCDCLAQHMRFVVGVMRHMNLNRILSSSVEHPSIRVTFFPPRLIVADDNH